MKAIVYSECGSPDALRLQGVPRPSLRNGDVLIRVQAAGSALLATPQASSKPR